VNKKITDESAEDLGLLVSQANKLVPSYGAIILFGTNRLRIFPDLIIKCVRFLGLNKTNVLDHVEIISYPILALNEILNFVRKNTRMGAEFSSLERVDIPEYPQVAVREIIINALLHADYAVKGAFITVMIYDDRLEVTNPGGVPIGMTLERALAGSSRVRNRVIARVFREIGLSEQWGSGLQRIIDACVQRGLKKPLFEDFGTEFKVTLYSTYQHELVIDKAQEKFIKHIRMNDGKISTKKAAAFWRISTRNARNKLKKFVESGVVKHLGTSPKDPRGVYVLSARFLK